MNPLLIEGGRLLAPTLIAAAKSIPASQLARFGLLRGPLVGLGPVGLGFAGGAALTILAFPESRRWIFGQVSRALHRAKATIEDRRGHNVPETVELEPEAARI